MKKFLLTLVLFLGMSASFAADRWWTYSNPFPIRDAVAYGEGVVMATGAGIRYRTIDYDYVFRSGDGLETSNFYGIIYGDVGLIGLSEYGQVYLFYAMENKWKIMNRSYETNQSRVVPGAAVYHKGYVVIPFENRLAFFDIDKSASVLTIDRIGSVSLASQGVSKVHVKEDSLFVRIGHDAYVHTMDWDNLSSDISLVDPETWTKLLVKPDSSMDADSVEGLELRGKKWSLKNGSATYELSADSVIYVNGDTRKNLSIYMEFLQGNAYELKPLPTGGVIAASDHGVISVYDGSKWKYGDQHFVIGSESAALGNHMKVLSILPNGTTFFHIMGYRYFIFDDWGFTEKAVYRPMDSECIDNFKRVEKNDTTDYSMSIASIPAPDGSGFLTTTGQINKMYSLLYFTKQGDIHCLKNAGSAILGGPMYAKIDDDGSWVVYVGTNDGTFSVNEGNVDVFRFPSPKSNGNEIVLSGKRKTLKGIKPAPVDMAYDSVGKRLWMVSTNNLAYYDEDQDTIYSPTSVNGMMGADFSSLEVDVHGNLWVGTTNQGVYRLSPKGKSPDTLSTVHFTTRQGLLSNNVSDIAIDNVNGEAWFAHENGVSVYHRNDLKNAAKNMTAEADSAVSAYPVPFRPKVHKFFIINNISEKAVVSIYNRGGALIRSFRNEEIIGGRLEWNGQDKDNRLVAPGVYYYVVKTPYKVNKGKFIIIH